LVNDTTRLLGLDGVEVTSVRLDDANNPMIALVTRDEQARCCPVCGVRSEHPHGWVCTGPRDLPVTGRPIVLNWTKRRRQCREPNRPCRTFTEALPQIPPRSRITGRLRASAGAAVVDRGRTIIQSARDREISWPVVQAAFAAHAAGAPPEHVPEVKHPGIDETRRGKAKFRLVAGWRAVKSGRWWPTAGTSASSI
jgi:transposase